MKKLLYICSLFFLIFTSCQNEDPEADPAVTTQGKTKVKFSLAIPEYQIKKNKIKASYENTLTDLWLMIFDSNGLFLERVPADNLLSEEDGNGMGMGSFEAQIPDNAGIIHFIANCDQLDSFDDRAAFQKSEREIIPSFTGDKLIFWGRNIISSLTAPINVTLYRNQAKVTVENQSVANFNLTGYAVCNYVTVGSAAPFNPDGNPSPFVLMDNIPTIPQGTLDRGNQTDADCDLNPKYMFENQNLYNNQAYVIIKGQLNNGPDLYYKIQLLDADRKPYPVVRNQHYKITIKSFSQEANGSSTFDDAKTSEPSNNIFAEISKDSPSISDDNNNTLTVGSVYYLYTQAGTLIVSAHYTMNGVPADNEVKVSIAEDQGNIIQGLSYNSSTGMITANVAKVVAGQQTATISVEAGILSRTVTIVSSALYNFTPAYFNPVVYESRDEIVTLNFTIPANVPSFWYPLKCEITTANLYPVDPNKNLEIVYVNGVYKYVYWATGPGLKTLSFGVGLENSDETVTIENDYFRTASVDLKARHITNASINGNNLVNYGANSQAILSFTIPAYPDYPPTYPLTVFVATNNLTTTQSGWTAVAGGYTHTYDSPPTGAQTIAFTSNKTISYETISISANGFSTNTFNFDNVLPQSVSVSNSIYVLSNGRYYTIPRYTVTSSNTAVAPGFNTGRNSTYSFQIPAGAKLTDAVTFSSSGYNGHYTVEQLMSSPQMILQ